MHSLKHMAAEFLIVVLGILVALGIDQWRQNRQELQVLDDSLTGVAAEIRGNIWTVERVRDTALTVKMHGLEKVIAFLSAPDAPVEDPAALLRTLADSSMSVKPWIVDDQLAGLRDSGNLRLLRNPDLARHLTDTYAAPRVLLSQVESTQGAYPLVVYQLLPASMQSKVNRMRWYLRVGRTAPVIADPAGASEAVEQIRARRVELLSLARGEAAVATGTWYALERMDSELHQVLAALATWDPEAKKSHTEAPRR